MKIVVTVRQWIEINIFYHIPEEVKVDKLWKKLNDMYEKDTIRNKTTTIRTLVNLKYKDGKSMTNHTNDFQGSVNQLAIMKMPLKDELQAFLLLSSMSDSYKTFVVSLSTLAPRGKLAMEIVKESLLSEEARRKEKGESFFEIPFSRKYENMEEVKAYM